MSISRPMLADKAARPDATWSFAERTAAKLFDLTGTVALVTGGSRGIGRGMAFALAQAGADVVITARNEDDLRETCTEIEAGTGRRALYTVGDVRDWIYLQATVDKCEKELGRLDILVPNAGITHRAPAEEMTEEAFKMVMDVNFTSVFPLCQIAHPLLKRGGRGKILTIGSEYSIYGSKNTVGYSSSKHAILGLTKSLAISWAKDHIQVNCVVPGWIYTDLAAGSIDSEPTASVIRKKTPDPRGYGYPEDMAGLTIFLASRASDFVTGQTIATDGGFEVAMAPHAGL